MSRTFAAFMLLSATYTGNVLKFITTHCLPSHQHPTLEKKVLQRPIFSIPFLLSASQDNCTEKNKNNNFMPCKEQLVCLWLSEFRYIIAKPCMGGLANFSYNLGQFQPDTSLQMWRNAFNV